MSTGSLFEAIVVDNEMPMEKQHLDEEIVDVYAQTEAHAHISISLVMGDRYEAARLDETGSLDKVDVSDIDTTDDGYGRTINAFEVFGEAGFRGKFYTGSDWVESESFSSIQAVWDWYSEHPESNPDAEDHSERTTLCWDGWSSVGGDSIVQSLSSRRAEELLTDE